MTALRLLLHRFLRTNLHNLATSSAVLLVFGLTAITRFSFYEEDSPAFWDLPKANISATLVSESLVEGALGLTAITSFCCAPSLPAAWEAPPSSSRGLLARPQL